MNGVMAVANEIITFKTNNIIPIANIGLGVVGLAYFLYNVSELSTVDVNQYGWYYWSSYTWLFFGSCFIIMGLILFNFRYYVKDNKFYYRSEWTFLMKHIDLSNINKVIVMSDALLWPRIVIWHYRKGDLIKTSIRYNMIHQDDRQQLTDLFTPYVEADTPQGVDGEPISGA